MSEMSEKIRTLFKQGDDIRDAGLSTPNDVVRVDNIPYGDNPDWQVMDLYRPVSAGNSILPVIVSIHGGGWVYGDKERYQYYCMSLAQRGFAVVNFTYRLAPDFQYPSSMEDTNLVFEWVMKNARDFYLDTKHIFAVGDSAGAHMLALYCDFTTNPEYAKTYPFKKPAGLKLTAVALNCGVYDWPEKFTDPTDMNAALMKDLLKNGGTPEEMNWISPIKHMTENFTPCYVMSATDDFLQAQVPGMVMALIQHAIPFEVHFYGTAENKLPHVFHCNMKSKDAKLCNDDEARYFKSFL